MNPIFKPTALSWEDIEGGLGESTIEAINHFTWDYCYQDTENPKCWDNDEALQTDLVFFRDAWARVASNCNKVAEEEQTAAIVSLIVGAFYDCTARDRIVQALVKSATKPQIVEIMTHVASVYCQYVALKARVEVAEAQREMEGRS